jgi:hypothetical protein
LRELPKDELYQLYCKKYYNYHVLAKHFRCSTETVRLNIELHDIPKKTKGNQLARRLKKSQSQLKQLLNDLYLIQKLSIDEIAFMLDTTSLTVGRNLKTLGITCRPAHRPSRKRI